MLFRLAPACWSVVRLGSMRFFVVRSPALRCSLSVLVSGVLVAVRSRLVPLRAFVPSLAMVVCGCRSRRRRVRLGCCLRLPVRVVSPVPALGRGLHWLLLSVPVCLASFFWGRFLRRRGGVCRPFLAVPAGLVVRVRSVPRQWCSCHCFSPSAPLRANGERSRTVSFFGVTLPQQRRGGARSAPPLLLKINRCTLMTLLLK